MSLHIFNLLSLWALLFSLYLCFPVGLIISKLLPHYVHIMKSYCYNRSQWGNLSWFAYLFFIRRREEKKPKPTRSRRRKTYLMSWSLPRLNYANISWSLVSWDDFMGQTPPLRKCYLGPNQLDTRLPSLIKVYILHSFLLIAFLLCLDQI